MESEYLTIDGKTCGHCVMNVKKESGKNDGTGCGGGAK